MWTYQACRDVDISCYGNHLTEYVRDIQARISNTIRFCDLVGHREPRRRQDLTHANPGFCVEHFPAVWVNLHELHSLVNPDALLAHEATHIELWFAYHHPFPTFVEGVSPSDQEVITGLVNLLSDLVVESHIIREDFTRSEDFEQQLQEFLKYEEQGFDYLPPYVRSKHKEFLRAVQYARLYLSPYCKPTHKRSLKKGVKRHIEAWAYLQRLIAMVRDAANIEEPTGQRNILSKIVDDFDLPQTYVLKTVRDFRLASSSA